MQKSHLYAKLSKASAYTYHAMTVPIIARMYNTFQTNNQFIDERGNSFGKCISKMKSTISNSTEYWHVAKYNLQDPIILGGYAIQYGSLFLNKYINNKLNQVNQQIIAEQQHIHAAINHPVIHAANPVVHAIQQAQLNDEFLPEANME